MVVNKLWSLDKVPSIKALREMFYGELRALGLRAHHVKQIYTYTRAVVKVSKSNGGKKPILGRLTARVDKYDYRLGLGSRTLVLKVHGSKEVRLKLLTSSKRIEKFREWGNHELAVKLVEGKVYVVIYFKKAVKPRQSETLMEKRWTTMGELVESRRKAVGLCQPLRTG